MWGHLVDGRAPLDAPKTSTSTRELLAALPADLRPTVSGGSQVAIQGTGCGTGATALAEAYVRAVPTYAYFVGKLEPYVAANPAHFRVNGDAIRCASALAREFMVASIQLYDPTAKAARDEMNARLGEYGISPGPQEASPSSQMYGVSQHLARLARVLPAAAEGDYRPLYTPNNELEQLQIFAGQMLAMLLQDPEMAAIMQQVRPLILELARIDREAIRQAAARVGQ